MAFLPRGENEERRRMDATDDALEERAMQLPFFRFENNVYCGAPRDQWPRGTLEVS